MALKTSKKSKKRPVREEFLYQPSLQLEPPPLALEKIYHRLLAQLARSIPMALALFIAMTVIEAQTHWLAGKTGREWLIQLSRLPSANSGQGNIGADSILAMLRTRFELSPVSQVFLGDSVFSPNLGGGAPSEVAVGSLASSQLAGSLNISQEGGEWGTNSLLLRRVIREPSIQQQKPLLITDINPKFFGAFESFSPAFPIEIPLCFETVGSDDPESADPDRKAVCDTLSQAWPRVLGALARVSPFLYRGLQGQLDFFMSFVQKAPAYELEPGAYNLRGLGFKLFRGFKSGLGDAGAFAKDYQMASPPMLTPNYTYALNEFINMLVFAQANGVHPKQAWLRSFARSISQWPGPVIVLWVNPAPGAEAVMTAQSKAGMEHIRQSMEQLVKSFGKKDLTFVSNREIAPLPEDYADSDHFSVSGHLKLAEYIRKRTQ